MNSEDIIIKDKEELWDVYTKDRVKTGRFHTRGQSLPEEDFHLVVHVCIFNSNNEMLIQQRQPFKHGWSNMWDLTVGGSALAGDSSTEAAEREVLEEIGLKIDLSDARPAFTINFPDGFDDYYIVRQDVDISTLKLQYEEVQTVKWASKEEVLRMQEEGTFIPYWFLDKLFDMEQWTWKNREFREVEGSKHWSDIKLITKGWSADKKYIIKTDSGEKLLLRISAKETFDEKKKEYDIIKRYAELGINMSKPVSFGRCGQDQYVYMLLTWVEGEDLEDVLPNLAEKEQYLLGRQAGEILKKIHSIEVVTEDVPANTKREKKLSQLERYEASAVRIDNDENAIKYVRDNIHKIWSKEPSYLHGDFHPGNLIYMADGSIGVIDFNRWEVGDPYEEFYKLESFGRDLSVPYCIGQIEAYFANHVPAEFWEILAVYVAHAAIWSIKWAEKFGQSEIDNMTERCRFAFEDYDNFERVVPKWYDDSFKEKYPVQ